MPAQWPSPGDYSAAIQNPQNCFNDPELKRGKAAVNQLGLPAGASGNFAVVYQLTTIKRIFAARCFIRPVTDQQKRYEELSRHLSGFSLHALVDFAYLPEGIRVRGRGYPLVRMEWVAGQQLHRYVAAHLSQADQLKQLAPRWRGVIAGLRGPHTAHGDLQHGNVLIDASGHILLVDYDGFFIPALRGQSPGEVGHPNYQHPERIEYGLYEENADNFSALVIYLSLLALKSDPEVWALHNGENLIFLADDFKRPGNSAVWLRLKANPNSEVRRLAGLLEAFCRESVASVPDLEEVIQGLPRKPMTVGAAGGTNGFPSSGAPTVPLVQRLDQIRTVISVALADGVLSPEEEKEIRQLGSKLEVPTNDLDKIIREEKRKRPGRPAQVRPNPATQVQPYPKAALPSPAPVLAGTPRLEISNSQFEYKGLRVGTIANGSFTISNTGGGALQGPIISNRPWLTPLQSQIDPSRHRQDISFNVDTNSLPLGFKERGHVELQSNGGTQIVQVDLSVEVPDEAVARFRSVLSWLGVFGGGLFGYALYQFLPSGPSRDVISGLAGWVGIIAAIVLGSRTGGFVGGCAAFILGPAILGTLQKLWPEAFSTLSWAITYGTFLHATARPLFIAKQATKRAAIPAVVGVTLGVISLSLAIIFGGILFGDQVASLNQQTGVRPQSQPQARVSSAISQNSVLPALQTGVVATCAEVRAWKDYTPKNEFHPGEAVCIYAEALNVNQDGRVDVSFPIQIFDMNGTAIAQKDGRYSTETSSSHIYYWDRVSLPQYTSPGTYTAVVEMRNNLTGQSGRGSTQFLVPAVSQSVQAGAQASTINIPANQEWTDTGLLVSQGAQIQITATGLAHPCMYNNCLDKRYQQWVGPEGFVNLPRLQQNSLPDMALIAKIDTWGPIYIGRDASFVAQVAGSLYLGVNDASNLSDNAGSFAATIRIGKSDSETSAPPPPTEGTDQRQPESEQSPNDPHPQTSLQPIDCREEKNFRSKQSTTSSIVQFDNNRYDSVRIYWINQSGNRVFYKDLAPSEAYVQSTFLTHPWVATDSQNRCLAIFLPEYGTGRAIVKMRP